MMPFLGLNCLQLMLHGFFLFMYNNVWMVYNTIKPLLIVLDEIWGQLLNIPNVFNQRASMRCNCDGFCYLFLLCHIKNDKWILLQAYLSVDNILLYANVSYKDVGMNEKLMRY